MRIFLICLVCLLFMKGCSVFLSVMVVLINGLVVICWCSVFFLVMCWFGVLRCVLSF